MGFAETGASRLKNNRNLVRSKFRMNSAHLKIGRSKKELNANHKKMSSEELEKFMEGLANERKRKNKKIIFSVISLVLAVVLTVVVLFLSLNK